jgi:hypothetical protein
MLALAGLIHSFVSKEGDALNNARAPIENPPLCNRIPDTVINVPDAIVRLREQAALLAGMSVDTEGRIGAFERTKVWNAYATRLNKTWQAQGSLKHQAIKRWADDEMSFAAESKASVFYPFGGPDFLYATLLFPKAPNYILIGLEPVGDLIPLETLPGKEAEKYLSEMETLLNNLITLGFFQTNSMKETFSRTRLNGVFPVLVALLARANNSIVDISLIKSGGQGKWITAAFANWPGGNTGSGMSTRNTIGIKISFQREPGRDIQTLYYFRLNLENSQIINNSEFISFINSQKPLVTLVKSASYLMHSPSFSFIRNQILENSSAILQDDSGIPLKYFDENLWALRFYGVYNGPISLFEEKYQANLKDRYSLKGKARELPFGFGYKWRLGASNVMLARRGAQGIWPSQPAPTTGIKGRYTIVIGSFATQAEANQMSRRMVEQGKHAFILTTPIERYRLCLGQYNTLVEARQALIAIKAEIGQGDAWLLKIDNVSSPFRSIQAPRE